MSVDRVKLRLRSGSREIEIEGARESVDDLLEKWWRPIEPERNEGEKAEDSSDPTPSAPRRTSRRRARSSSSQQPRRPGESNVDPSVAPHVIANKVKEHDRFDQIEKKLLLADGVPAKKVALVCQVADKPLTSGQIHKVLKELGIRIGLPQVSRVLKSTDFLTTDARKLGGKPPQYSLTAKARAEFETWLNADGQ